jgi:hypothetical protein
METSNYARAAAKSRAAAEEIEAALSPVHARAARCVATHREIVAVCEELDRLQSKLISLVETLKSLSAAANAKED